MIINHPEQYVYLDVPVCASSSLEEYLLKCGGVSVGSRHHMAVPEECRDYKQIAVTRHPYARALALWQVLCRDHYRLPQVGTHFCQLNGLPNLPSWEQFVDILLRRHTLPAPSRFYTGTISEHLGNNLKMPALAADVSCLASLSRFFWDVSRRAFVPVETVHDRVHGPWDEAAYSSAVTCEPWFMGKPDVDKLFTPEIREKLRTWADDDFRSFDYRDEIPDLSADLYQQSSAYAYDEDHLPFRYGLNPLRSDGFVDYYRIPAALPEKPIVCLGSAYTFGRFTRDPYPDLLAKALNRPVLNLGGGLATPHSYLASPPALRLIAGASAVIIQVMSARVSPNTLFTFSNNHCRGQLDMRTGKWIPDIDKRWDTIRREDPDLYRRLYAESVNSFKVDMVRLLGQARHVPKILVWWSLLPPQPVARDPAICQIYYPNFHPQMVDVGCVDLFRSYCQEYVEETITKGGWQPETEDVMERSPYYPSPEDHARLAEKLLRVPSLQSLK